MKAGGVAICEYEIFFTEFDFSFIVAMVNQLMASVGGVLVTFLMDVFLKVVRTRQDWTDLA